MNHERLLQHFERISEAPDAVPRLRQFVLDLAVRGKLVEQDPNNEPAEELLKRIEAEKVWLVKEGKIKAPKTGSRLLKDESPYDVPDSWTWIPFSDLISHSDAGVSPKTEGFPKSGNAWGVLKVSAVSWDKFNPDENKQLLPGATFPESAQVQIGDFLISRANTSELLAKCVIVEDQPKNIILSDKIVRLYITEYCEKRFLCFVNNHSAYARTYYASKGSGTSHSMKNVSRPIIYALPIPLPPLAEQHRIVAKVDELMALCDQLAAAKTEREQSRDRLVAASLHRLTSPVDTAEADAPDLLAHQSEAFSDHARFVFNHLPRLTTRPGHIKQLRQTILNLAVCGKLSPVADWLEQSETLGAVALLQNGYAFKSEWFVSNGIRLLRNANVSHGMLCWDELACLPENRVREFERFLLSEGEVVLSLDRPFIVTGTKVARVRPQDMPCLLLQRVGRFQLNSDRLCPDYLFLWLNSPHFTNQIDPGRSNGVPHISSKQVEAAEIFVPPLAEQHRIVARVDELMALCDELEAQLTTTEADSRRLLEAVLHEALAPALEETV